MPPSSRSVCSAFDSITKSSFKNVHVCRACRQVLSSRNYASIATAQASVEPSSSESLPAEPAASPLGQSRIEVKAGIVLSRAPLITPEPHSFETAYYLYQRRLNERLVLPFTQYFYYRRGTPAFDHWKLRRNNRGGAAARDIGKYNAYTDESWNDEVVMGEDCAQPGKIVERLIEEEGRAEEFAGEGDVKMAGLRRITEADSKNDHKSLERRLSGTLYLLVKYKPTKKDEPENTLWRFPSGVVEGKESLKEAAQRTLGLSCGPNINTWFVGNHPVGHHVRNLKALENSKPAESGAKEAIDEEKTFFMKARIMAGQADLKLGQQDVQDFKWLSKEEIEQTVSRGYWSSIKNMLVGQ